jgi:indolepyruvate ferredoxin oxidoreductase
LATQLLGDGIYTNPFVLGFAWQKGWIPLAYETLVRAIELNGVAIDANKRAFEWGRAAAHDAEAVRKAAFPAQVIELKRASSIEDVAGRRVEFLTAYQSANYAKRYSALVDRVRRVESDRLQSTRLTEAVARYYFKLLAIKDEYEVARLHADPAFRAKIAGMFEGDYRLNFHLAPPLLARRDPVTGKVRKMRFGPWMTGVFAVLAKLKGLRGSALDVFGYTAERRTERALIGEYEKLVDELLAELAVDNHAVAVELASLPEEIRGYGHVKAQHLEKVRAKQADLLARFRGQGNAQVIRMPAKAA